jgi:hypothetical protein
MVDVKLMVLIFKLEVANAANFEVGSSYWFMK